MSLTPQSLLKVTISVFDTLDAFLETLLYYSVPVITRTTVANQHEHTLFGLCIIASIAVLKCPDMP